MLGRIIYNISYSKTIFPLLSHHWSKSSDVDLTNRKQDSVRKMWSRTVNKDIKFVVSFLMYDLSLPDRVLLFIFLDLSVATLNT